jgi:hypothetical protein
MARKTERLYGSAPLDGDNLGTSVKSFAAALNDLEVGAAKQNRDVLYDTLEVELDKIEERTIMSAHSTLVATVINVSAEAVLRVEP